MTRAALRPSERVARALARVSRDRWLSPSDVCRIGSAFARRAGGCGSGIVYRAAVPDECMVVGMFRGRPPAFQWEPHYRRVIETVERPRKHGELIELLLLETAAAHEIGWNLYENDW